MSRQAPCAEWQDAISAYMDGALPVPEEQRVHAHLRQCPACAALLVDLVPVVQALHAMPAPRPGRDPWPAIARALQQDARFRSRRLIVFPRAGWVAASFVAITAGSLAFMATQETAGGGPVADVDVYWEQHEFFSHEEGLPTLFAPELSAIEASYRIDP